MEKYIKNNGKGDTWFHWPCVGTVWVKNGMVVFDGFGDNGILSVVITKDEFLEMLGRIAKYVESR